MGFFDKFKSKQEQIGKDKKPKHVVVKEAKHKADEAKKKQFAAVPSAGHAPKKHDEKSPAPHGAPAKSVAKRKENTGNAYRILVRVLVSEKATALAATNQYAFVVAASANKIEVSKAIKALFGVQTQKVNIMNYRGKSVRYGRSMGSTKRWKKAIVTLPAGQKIDMSGI